jgi:hypothetical protein
MANVLDRTINKALKTLRARKVLTIEELATLLQRSLPTARRRLKAWSTLTSYNKNGRYYVLPDVPQFDSNGLWCYRGIGFSRYGNLTETLTHLVCNSQAGLNAAELGQLLQMDPRSFLSLFRNHPDLKREKHQGRFVYFATQSEIYRKQKAARSTMEASARLPSGIETVAILVEAIKHPESGIELLCRRLKRQGLAVTEQAVSNLFAYHGLDVKKTARSR